MKTKQTVTLKKGDCVKVMRGLDDNSVDSIVTDPPYELGFMGKGWDKSGIANSVEMWTEALRVMKPGGYLLAFSGSRTYHRMVCAIEDAGFEVRDQIMWVYGSGFPKSHNLGNGWGTALKPAHEPIVVARKPLQGTVAQNVQKWGTGALNIDGSRVGGESTKRTANIVGVQQFGGANHRPQHDSAPVHRENGSDAGRWPANLIHDGSPEVLDLFAQFGEKRSAGDYPSDSTVRKGATSLKPSQGQLYADTGTAARFFYSAKSSKAERGEGNNHPCVKPRALMAYLCRLVTPPGGLILDPFMGSGSTGIGAALGGFSFIGCDLSAEYVEIARRRIAAARKKPAQRALPLLKAA